MSLIEQTAQGVSFLMGGVAADIGSTVGPAMVGIAVAALGVSLAVGWVRRIRSAV